LLGYVKSRGDGEMTKVRYHTIRHIQRVNQHVSVSLADCESDAFARWATRANAIVFLPDGSVRDPQGQILLDAGGRSDPQAQVPYPREAWDRKARIDVLIKAKGIHVFDRLPPVVCEPELRLRAEDMLLGALWPCWSLPSAPSHWPPAKAPFRSPNCDDASLPPSTTFHPRSGPFSIRKRRRKACCRSSLGATKRYFCSNGPSA